MDLIPCVSVIVPMYNVEKYIAELLESILAQTLQNFELIIVDDCSTDKSCAIVESYQPRFGDKLQLMRLPKNSGGASVPRNRGLEMSRGKYIFFLDNDDVLVNTALEELFNVAEKFSADVVYCEKFYISKGIGNEFRQGIKIVAGKSAISNEDNLMTENLVARVNAWINFQFGVMPWLCLSSRKFLIESEIKFRDVRREDVFWSLEVLFSARKILRRVKPCYVHRSRDDSLGHTGSDSLTKYIGYWVDRTVNGLKLLEDFLLKINFFRANPAYRYAILNHWAMGDLQMMAEACAKLPPFAVKEVFQQVFSKNLGDKDTLVSYLFANSIFLIQNLSLANRKIMELSTPPRPDSQ